MFLKTKGGAVRSITDINYLVNPLFAYCRNNYNVTRGGLSCTVHTLSTSFFMLQGRPLQWGSPCTSCPSVLFQKWWWYTKLSLSLSNSLSLSLSHSLSVTVCGVCQPLSVYPAAIEKLCGGHQALEMATLLPILVGQKTGRNILSFQHTDLFQTTRAGHATTFLTSQQRQSDYIIELQGHEKFEKC